MYKDNRVKLALYEWYIILCALHCRQIIVWNESIALHFAAN